MTTRSLTKRRLRARAQSIATVAHTEDRSGVPECPKRETGLGQCAGCPLVRNCNTYNNMIIEQDSVKDKEWPDIDFILENAKLTGQIKKARVKRKEKP